VRAFVELLYGDGPAEGGVGGAYGMQTEIRDDGRGRSRECIPRGVDSVGRVVTYEGHSSSLVGEKNLQDLTWFRTLVRRRGEISNCLKAAKDE
jgi:hypothetical protein